MPYLDSQKRLSGYLTRMSVFLQIHDLVMSVLLKKTDITVRLHRNPLQLPN